MRVLLIDNYDSFTHNLAHLVASVTGALPWVVRNDERTVEELCAWGPDRVILSPGPGRPEVAGDIGVCAGLIERLGEVPILGVCLGHQAIGAAHGARVVHAPAPVHGRVATVEHDGGGLFRGVPKRFRAVRYHSFVLDRDSLPPSLRVTAWTDDGLIMAIAHQTRPHCGVQFHPESILSDGGREILGNFLGHSRLSRPGDIAPLPGNDDRRRRGGQGAESAGALVIMGQERPEFGEMRSRGVTPWIDPERAFCGLFGQSEKAFWLDSADGVGFSYMGECAEDVRVEGNRVFAGERVYEGPPFSLIAQLLAEGDWARAPLEFPSGLVGYLGYELKGWCGDRRRGHSALPDAWLLRARRTIAFDHAARTVTLFAADGDAGWLDETARRLAHLPDLLPLAPSPRGPLDFRLARDEARYRADIARVKERLRDGETYETCLTTQVRCAADVDSLALYRALRARNPAPFAAYLRFGDLRVLSTSPERFVHVAADGAVESRPIKGTRRRGRSPEEDARLARELAESDKDRAENLMIVDLVRNDLGRVCVPGSVHVPSLMAVEAHPTVFQLVSTVRGRLREEVTPLEAVRALFPGGSMTGAPKVRSLRIIDELEGAPRGVYSGGIGYLSSTGAVNLAMAIRTIVARPGELSFGIGGAIVNDSDPDDEIAEIKLKGKALIEAIVAATGATGYSLS